MKSVPALSLAILAVLTSCKGKYYNNPTASMEATLKQGERFYVTATEEFNRNDVVVFDYYGNDYQSRPDETGKYPLHWEKRVCRLIAMSGDTLQIRNADVLINNHPVVLPENAVTEYELRSLKPLDPVALRSPEYGPGPYKDDGDTFHYVAFLTKSEVREYEINTSVTSVKKIISDSLENNFDLACYKDTCNWSVDNYGPVTIPSPGQIIMVDDHNFSLYKNIPGIQKGKWVVRENLYFVMGDNRHMSEDSRYIGFISHSNMNGIVK